MSITLELDSKSELKVEDGRITDTNGQALAYFDKSWKKAVDNSGKWRYPRIQAKLGTNNFATLAIPAKPLAVDARFAMDNSTFDTQRKL